MRFLLFALALTVVAPAFAQAGTPPNNRAPKPTVEPARTAPASQQLARRPGPRPPVPGTPAALRAEWMD
jgi:hypothetical protein